MAPSDETILVTGATGYLAGHIIKSFLEAGYKVRGTIRSDSGIPKIKAAQGDLSKNLSFVTVTDIATPHAFDEAVKGVSGIIATANPFMLSPTNMEEDLLKPSINGVLSLLDSAALAGPQLKRVVLTASFASMLDMAAGTRDGYVYTEADWNPATYEEAAASSNGGFAYCAAKGLAERAGWDWMKEKKPSFGFIAINPPWVFGPQLNEITNLDQLNESSEAIWKLINGSLKEVPPHDFLGFVNATDIANAHLLAYENEAAAGERFLVGSHFDYQSAIDEILEAFPELKGRVPEGVKGAGLDENLYQLDASKVKKVLGLKLTSLKDTMIDTVKVLLEAEKKTGWQLQQ